MNKVIFYRTLDSKQYGKLRMCKLFNITLNEYWDLLIERLCNSKLDEAGNVFMKFVNRGVPLKHIARYFGYNYATLREIIEKETGCDH